MAYDSDQAYGKEICELCGIPLGWETVMVSLFRAGVSPRHFHHSCFAAFRERYSAENLDTLGERKEYLNSLRERMVQSQRGDDPNLDAGRGR